MADSEGTEAAQMEDATKSLEKEQPEPMDEEQSIVQEEAPKANENGHQTDEAAPEGETKEEPSKDNESVEQTEEATPEGETKEEPSKDNESVEQTEEATPEVPKEEESAKGSENGDQDKKETAEDKPSEEKQEAKTEEAKEEDKGHGATVAKHYNEHKENTREERKTSPIFYLRNFNNWVKSVLINEFMEKYKRNTFRNLSVLDLACGKGGDLLKWQKARISNLVCADIAEVSMKQCEQRYKDLRYSRNHRRYNQSQNIYDAQFITADCTKEDIGEKFTSRNRDVEFDMTSCQFALHYAFESPEQAEKMLQNACERLKPGGYFIGTIPCANEIINRLRQSEDMSFENDCYKISFTEKENISLFGHKYNFHLEGVVDCPEFLVHFPLLEKMATKFGLTLELAQGFHHFFEDHKDKDEYRFLLNRMNALETYPPRREGDKPVSDKEDAYTQAKEILGEEDDKDERKCVGTLSKDEWEAAGLYMVFAFKKAEQAPKPTPVEEVKTDVDKTEVSEQQSVEKDGDKEDGDKEDGDKEDDDKKDEEMVEEEDKNVEEQDTEIKMDPSEEKDVGDKNDEDAEQKAEGTDEKGEGSDEKGEDADGKAEDAEIKDKDAEIKDEDAEIKDEDAEIKDEDAEIKDEDAEIKDEDAETKDEDTDKKDDHGDKKDDDVDEKDEVGDQMEGGENTSTEVFQGSEAGEQGGEEEENTQAKKKPTPQRGRRKRSAGAAKDEAATSEESTEVTPKRGARKRKSTGGVEEEPPEKKKA